MIWEKVFNKAGKPSFARLFLDLLKHIIWIEKIIAQDIKNENFDKQLLWLSIRRVISHGKAISFLCKRKQNLEALMLLRPMIEVIVNLRWIVEDTSGENKKQFMESTESQIMLSSGRKALMR